MKYDVINCDSMKYDIIFDPNIKPNIEFNIEPNNGPYITPNIEPYIQHNFDPNIEWNIEGNIEHILDSQPSWKSSKFQLARWSHEVAI